MVSSIVVHLDTARSLENRVKVATTLAERFAAQLRGIYLTSAPDRQATQIEDVDAAPLDRPQLRLVGAPSDAATGDARVLKKRLAKLAGEGYPLRWKTHSFNDESHLIELSHYHDLLVVGDDLVIPENPIGKLITPSLKLALDAVCPVLVVPGQARPRGDFTRPVVFWDQSRECSRALRAAFPFLKSVDTSLFRAESPVPGMDGAASPQSTQEQLLLNFLDLHGIEAHWTGLDQYRSDVADEAEALLQNVDKDHNDLIVMGAYGHSKIRELLLGSAGRKLLQKARVPVLLAN